MRYFAQRCNAIQKKDELRQPGHARIVAKDDMVEMGGKGVSSFQFSVSLANWRRMGVSTQGCEYATLGFEIQPLRGKYRQEIAHDVVLWGWNHAMRSIRWYRCAQSPANLCDPFGIENHLILSLG